METTPRIQVTALKYCNKLELEGLLRVKRCIEDYLKAQSLKNNSSSDVVLYLEKVKFDDELLFKYLRGRKNNPSIAWNSLRWYAENKFEFYPDMFPKDVVPERVRELVAGHVVGVLKHCDKLGRRIGFIDITKWNPDVHTMDDITRAAVMGCEIFWKEPEVMKNGVVLIENTEGFGLAHAKQQTMHCMMRTRNVFLYSFPASLKGIYFLNAPKLFRLVSNLSKALFPKKMRSRLFLYSADQSPKELLEIAPPEILPTWAGGKLSIEEAAEGVAILEEKVRLQ